jgi:hypothetical protein
MSSIKLAAAVVVSAALGCGYAPIALFIAAQITALARIVGGGA